MAAVMREREDDALRGVDAPTYCECGCGESTNEKCRKAQRLRANGWRNVEIAQEWMMSPGSVKALLRNKPGRFVRGHYGATLRSADAYEQTCVRCGTSMVRASPTRYCGRLRCLGQNGEGSAAGMAAAITQETERRQAARADALKAWYLTRRLRVERLARRRRYQSPEFQRHIQRERVAFASMREADAHAWLIEQSLEVQEFIEASKDPSPSWVSLDAALAVDSSLNRYDRTGEGGMTNRGQIEWSDPTADAAIRSLEWQEESSGWDFLGDAN